MAGAIGDKQLKEWVTSNSLEGKMVGETEDSLASVLLHQSCYLLNSLLSSQAPQQPPQTHNLLDCPETVWHKRLNAFKMSLLIFKVPDELNLIQWITLIACDYTRKGLESSFPI